MNSFDFEIITFFNRFSQHAGTFDALVGILSVNHLVKGGVLAMLLWWAWFTTWEANAQNRERITCTLFSCVFGFILARVLALTLPFRLRPRHDPNLPFLLPQGADSTLLDGWSSFPSDYAVLFFALSTGLFFISRRAGVFAFVYTTVMICLPRIYLGLHYPTDIIAGAGVGIAVAAIANIFLVKNRHIRSVVGWSHRKPARFYPLFFLLTYQIADMFDSSKAVLAGANLLAHWLAGCLGH